MLEKRARAENNSFESASVCKQVLEAAWKARNLAKLREWLPMLVRRRGQAKQAVQEMVKLCVDTYLPELAAQSREETFWMLAVLREVSEGKMFLEGEFAQCTRQLCEMHESDGKLEEACKIIQEIQIETYGSLKNKDKVLFILYQMKLVLARQDYVRLQILSRKIVAKALQEEGLEQAKVEYWEFLVKFYVHEKDYLNAATAHRTIYDECVKSNLQSPDYRARAFQNFVVYLLVSPYAGEKVALLTTLEAVYARELEKEPLLARLVRKLLTFELMPMDEAELEANTACFEPFNAQQKHHLRELFKQLIQHNMRVIEKFYSRIRLERLAVLVGVSQARAEQEICDMVVKKLVSAKINRMEGVVAFNQKRKTANEQLSAWNADIKTTLELVESTCHLINRDIITERA